MLLPPLCGEELLLQQHPQASSRKHLLMPKSYSKIVNQIFTLSPTWIPRDNNCYFPNSNFSPNLNLNLF